jgi:hypothetical protein
MFAWRGIKPSEIVAAVDWLARQGANPVKPEAGANQAPPREPSPGDQRTN